MTNGHLLSRQIRLWETVFVSSCIFFFFFTTHSSASLPTRSVLISFPSKRQTCAKSRCALNEASSHICWQVLALGVLPALSVKRCHPFSDLVPPPPPPKRLAVSFLCSSRVLVAISQEFMSRLEANQVFKARRCRQKTLFCIWQFFDFGLFGFTWRFSA